MIWTDCDREGEHIGQEIVDAAKVGNAAIQVKRARFSNVERAYVLNAKFYMLTCRTSTDTLLPRHVLSAARRLVELDEKQVNAVSARIELDLRIGYAFTRFITNTLKHLGGPLADLVLSYGKIRHSLPIHRNSIHDLGLKKPHRVMPISNSGIRGGSVFSRQEFCP